MNRGEKPEGAMNKSIGRGLRLFLGFYVIRLGSRLIGKRVVGAFSGLRLKFVSDFYCMCGHGLRRKARGCNE